jgi:hypothetical protein
MEIPSCSKYKKNKLNIFTIIRQQMKLKVSFFSLQELPKNAIEFNIEQL